MYVCVCNAVTERHIHDAVEHGVRRMRELRDHLGVAADCGRCASCAHACLKSALGSQVASVPQTFPAAFSLMEAR